MLALLITGPAAAQPTPHEYFEPSPGEDALLGTTAMGSSLPAALQTSSGLAIAPDVSRPTSPLEKAYGGSSTPESVDASYRVDPDTTRPDVVSYDDPFIPAVTPFKRLYAYDSVSDDLELVVNQKALTPLEVGGEVGRFDDQFFADMTVDLEANVPVRIPSPGPMARVIKLETQPPATLELLRDSADNWFIRAQARARVRLVMQIAVPRAAFSGALADVGDSALASSVPRLPASIRPAAMEVATQIGVSRAQTPKERVKALVAYFRSFAPSGDKPQSYGAQLYLDLALGKKGVCRHRAYAFVITAHAVGVPARMVRNEAHAWVEVYDGHVWHRIDLGGAAARMELEEDTSKLTHQPPADPYDWPAGSERGTDMASHASTSPGGGDPGAPGDEPGGSSGSMSSVYPQAGDPASPPSSPSPSPLSSLLSDPPPGEAPDQRPIPELEVQLPKPEARRGHPLSVQGQVTARGASCAGVRVDIGLKSSSGAIYVLQSLAADAEGRFDGAVMVPFHLGVGEYEVLVSTPGNDRCGAALNH